MIIAGVGINDAGYTVKSRGKITCPYYKVWYSMINRVYAPSHGNHHSCYKGVAVCKEWHTFSSFKTWMQSQDWEGNFLDKDILGDGTLYSPDTCIFITRDVNNFISRERESANGLPHGVHQNKSGSFVATCGRSGVKGSGYIGSYPTAQLAREAYLSRKAQMAEVLISVTENEIVKNKLRERYLN